MKIKGRTFAIDHSPEIVAASLYCDAVYLDGADCIAVAQPFLSELLRRAEGWAVPAHCPGKTLKRRCAYVHLYYEQDVDGTAQVGWCKTRTFAAKATPWTHIRGDKHDLIVIPFPDFAGLLLAKSHRAPSRWIIYYDQRARTGDQRWRVISRSSYISMQPNKRPPVQSVAETESEAWQQATEYQREGRTPNTREAVGGKGYSEGIANELDDLPERTIPCPGCKSPVAGVKVHTYCERCTWKRKAAEEETYDVVV